MPAIAISRKWDIVKDIFSLLHVFEEDVGSDIGLDPVDCVHIVFFVSHLKTM